MGYPGSLFIPPFRKKRGRMGHPAGPSDDKIDALSGAALGEEEADPAADGPGEEPGYPIPVGPGLAPVRDGGGEAHDFSEDEEPEDMLCGWWRGEAGTDPGTEDRHDDETCGACHERGVGGDVVFGEFAGEDEGQERVGGEDQHDREQIASYDNGDGFEHRLRLRGCGGNRFGQIYMASEEIAR
jgi:hypothetical protein